MTLKKTGIWQISRILSAFNDKLGLTISISILNCRRLLQKSADILQKTSTWYAFRKTSYMIIARAANIPDSQETGINFSEADVGTCTIVVPEGEVLVVDENWAV